MKNPPSTLQGLALSAEPRVVPGGHHASADRTMHVRQMHSNIFMSVAILLFAANVPDRHTAGHRPSDDGWLDHANSSHTRDLAYLIVTGTLGAGAARRGTPVRVARPVGRQDRGRSRGVLSGPASARIRAHEYGTCVHNRAHTAREMTRARAPRPLEWGAGSLRAPCARTRRKRTRQQTSRRTAIVRQAPAIQLTAGRGSGRRDRLLNGFYRSPMRPSVVPPAPRTRLQNNGPRLSSVGWNDD